MTQQTETTQSELEQIDADWCAGFRRKIKRWFKKNARDLPWRNKSDPYEIWVSEIMLQQTQVATVERFYDRFIRRFPDVVSLADAAESEVLRYWEGLGYYRRARQMHAASRVMVAKHGGAFPTEFDEVIALPGIGRYTAGAILSFALDRRLPIVEANTVRLYARLIGLTRTVEESSSQKCLWQFASMILPRGGCGDFNQALMELGSLVCTPKGPSCDRCPAASLCLTNIQGLQDSIPIRKMRPQFKQVEESILIVQRRGKLLMRICGEDEWWTGLWDFPRYRVAAQDLKKLAADFHRQTGLVATTGQTIASLKHTVTNHNIKLTCYAAELSGGRLKSSATITGSQSAFKWVSVSDLHEYPLCVTARKIVKQIGI